MCIATDILPHSQLFALDRSRVNCGVNSTSPIGVMIGLVPNVYFYPAPIP